MRKLFDCRLRIGCLFRYRCLDWRNSILIFYLCLDDWLNIADSVVVSFLTISSVFMSGVIRWLSWKLSIIIPIKEWRYRWYSFSRSFLLREKCTSRAVCVFSCSCRIFGEIVRHTFNYYYGMALMRSLDIVVGGMRAMFFSRDNSVVLKSMKKLDGLERSESEQLIPLICKIPRYIPWLIYMCENIFLIFYYFGCAYKING